MEALAIIFGCLSLGSDGQPDLGQGEEHRLLRHVVRLKAHKKSAWFAETQSGEWPSLSGPRTYLGRSGETTTPGVEPIPARIHGPGPRA